MVEKQALGGLKRKAARQRPPAGRLPKGKLAEEKRAEAVDLIGTNVSTFKAGAGTVEVLLSGEGLNTPGLRAIILGPDKKTPVRDSNVIIEQPLEDDLAYFEFPITIKVIDSPAGQHYFALLMITLSGGVLVPKIVDVLEYPSITFE